jgi:hypothetical protein
MKVSSNLKRKEKQTKLRDAISVFRFPFSLPLYIYLCIYIRLSKQMFDIQMHVLITSTDIIIFSIIENLLDSTIEIIHSITQQILNITSSGF